MAITMDRLSEIRAVSGAEYDMRSYLIPEIKKHCDSFDVDSIGNIIALKKGKSNSKKILIGTHIDEVGFIVDSITDSGFVKFKSVGIIDPRVLVSKKVIIGKDAHMGVIGMKAIHLQKKKERESTVNVKDLYIDIGETTKKDAEKRISLGDRITFATEFCDLGEVVRGKALGRLGCIALLDAMKETPQLDTYFVFASQGEVVDNPMGRGMRVATHRINPDLAVVISAVNSEDFKDEKSVSARLGKGAVIEFGDKTSLSNIKLANKLIELAQENEIPYQVKTSFIGASESGAVMISASGAAVATVSIPVRYLRTPVGFMNKNDLNGASKLLSLFTKESDVIFNGIA